MTAVFGAALAVMLTRMSVPAVDTSFKAYMDWEAITNERSEQYRMQRGAVTDENGLRIYDGCYMVALGSYYGKVGDRFVITLDTGTELDVIMGDMKSDCDTDVTHRYHPMESGGNVVEFIVDTDELDDVVRLMGDVSYADSIFEGSVRKIEKVIR